MSWFKSRRVLQLGAFASAVGGIVLLKEVSGGPNYDGEMDLNGKTVIVTGANTGIGMETAMGLAKRKANVILACRDLEKCALARRDIFLETANNKLTCMDCDLASFDSIRQFAEKVNKENPEIHLLVNNAGVMRCPLSFTTEGIELQLGVNHMGHFLLTHLLLDKLKSSGPSRIVNLSSVAHNRGVINFNDLNSAKKYDASEAYNQSKLANVLFTTELAKRLEGTSVTCNSVHPGIVNTEITRHIGIAKSWIAMLFAKPILWFFTKTPRQGAQTTLFVALSPDLNGVSGKYFSSQMQVETSSEGKDEAAAQRLWAISEKWTKLT